MKKLLPIIFIFLAFIAPAQKINESYQLHIKQTTSKINIDGILDDEAWKNTDVAKDFWLKFPTDTAHANNQTEVRLTYDDNFLYVSAICFKANDGKSATVESMKRDYIIPYNECFQIVIEPFNDLTNGFIFGVNAAGAQLEGLISEGQVLNLNWDNKWYSQTKYLADRWIVEMAIPFKTLRYKKDVSTWGVNFTRNYPNQKEVSVWAKIPRQLTVISLAHTGMLVWETLPVSPKANISIIPYALGGINKDFQKNINQGISDTYQMFDEAYQELGCKTNPEAPVCQIKVRLIYYALREQTLDKVFVQALSAFESVSRSKGIIAGVNLVEAEDGYISLRDYHKHMLIFNYLHNLYPKVPISLHAGELDPKTITSKNLSFHIHDALITGKANRIGHGVDIAFEKNPNIILKHMAKYQVPVEINLISNLKILNISGKQHPLTYYLQNQVPVVLSTDDEGILRTNLTHQYVDAAKTHGLDYQHLKQINRNALTFAFLPGKSIWANTSKEIMVQECQDLYSQSCQKFTKKNEKASLQWSLEQKLIAFESKF